MCRFRRQRIAWSCQANMAVFSIYPSLKEVKAVLLFCHFSLFFNPFERETCTLFWMCYSSSLKPFFKLKRCWLFPHLTVFSFYPWLEVRCTSQSVSIPPIQIWFSSVAITFPLSWTAFRLIEYWWESSSSSPPDKKMFWLLVKASLLYSLLSHHSFLTITN